MEYLSVPMLLSRESSRNNLDASGRDHGCHEIRDDHCRHAEHLYNPILLRNGRWEINGRWRVAGPAEAPGQQVVGPAEAPGQ